MMIFFGSFRFALDIICAAINKSSINIPERHVILFLFHDFVCLWGHIKLERFTFPIRLGLFFLLFLF